MYLSMLAQNEEKLCLKRVYYVIVDALFTLRISLMSRVGYTNVDYLNSYRKAAKLYS